MSKQLTLVVSGIALCLALLPGTSEAQAGVTVARFESQERFWVPRWQPLAHVSEGSRSVSSQPSQTSPSRDSLKNGALNGAIIGALALGGVAAVVCGVAESRDVCLPDTLTFAAIGAGIGIGAGVAIDAAISQDVAVVRASIRF